MIRTGKKFILVILIVIAAGFQGCTIYHESLSIKPEEVRLQKNIKVTSVYTIYGDTLMLDYKSILAVTISDSLLTFYDSSGEYYSIPCSRVASMDIKYKNERGSSALNISLLTLSILAASAILLIPLIILLCY